MCWVQSERAACLLCRAKVSLNLVTTGPGPHPSEWLVCSPSFYNIASRLLPWHPTLTVCIDHPGLVLLAIPESCSTCLPWAVRDLGFLDQSKIRGSAELLRFSCQWRGESIGPSLEALAYRVGIASPESSLLQLSDSSQSLAPFCGLSPRHNQEALRVRKPWKGREQFLSRWCGTCLTASLCCVLGACFMGAGGIAFPVLLRIPPSWSSGWLQLRKCKAPAGRKISPGYWFRTFPSPPKRHTLPGKANKNFRADLKELNYS